MADIKSNFRDLFLMLKSKEMYKNEIYKRYSDELSGFEDLVGDSEKDMSALFYLFNRKFLYLLDNDPDIAIREKDIYFRKKFYRVLKLVAPYMLGCTQIIEDREKFADGIDDTIYSDKITSKPVIYVSNHGMRDDGLTAILAAGRPAYIYWGSLPLFYNTMDGLAASLVGEIIVNRKSKSSKTASISKALKVMEYGADMIMYPEGGWNKTSEKLVLNLWKGVHKIAAIGGYDVVPMVHYSKSPEVVNKKNIIHTIVDKPIPLYKYEEKEGLQLLRDVMATWQYKLMETYGKSTRQTEMGNWNDSNERWDELIKQRMRVVTRYDSSIERVSDYRPKDIVRPEDAFAAIAEIKNITPYNAQMVKQAREIVRIGKYGDFQRRY